MEARKGRRFVEKEPLNDIWRITARGYLFKQKDKLEEQSSKYLNADAIGIKLVVSLLIGGWFLFLRVLAYGYPPMPETLMASDSLQMAGLIMWWPVYAIGVLSVWLIWSFAQKIRLGIKIRRLDRQIYEYRC